ncbi:MAG: nucleotidyl transferase AbiEii/AbiGii toxin family protein [Patescibacteria group bacterium]
MLKNLGLAEVGESDLLFLKVEIFSEFNFCGNYKTEMVPIFKFNKSLLVRVFDLPTLMATKIRAVLFRKWLKKNKKGEVLAIVKGRDYFDLLWYLDKGVEPNLSCLDHNSMADLKKDLINMVGQADARSIKSDLEPLIADTKFVDNFSKDFEEILKKKIGEIATKSS